MALATDGRNDHAAVPMPQMPTHGLRDNTRWPVPWTMLLRGVPSPPNAIAPGYFPSELTLPVYDKKLLDHHASMTAVGRAGELDDLDGATIFLASRAAAYITG
jgi:hypothetical protein